MTDTAFFKKLKVRGFQTNSNTINLTIQNHGRECGHWALIFKKIMICDGHY